MDLIIDTQILSYRFKGVEEGIHNTPLAIASITANEFLVAQSKESEQPNYYTIHPAKYPNLEYNSSTIDHFGNPKCAKLGARRTDRIIIDFGTQFSTNDNLLNRFAAEYYEAPIHKHEDELLIDFSEKQVERRKSRESKSYINKGWSYAIRNNRTPSET